MPWRIQNVNPFACIIKLHHRAGNGNSTLLLNFHPVGFGKVTGLSALNGTCSSNNPTKQKQLFGDGRFSGIGVRNDRKSAPGAVFLFFNCWVFMLTSFQTSQ